MSSRCVYFACAERVPDAEKWDDLPYWWRDYGCCSREHAELHYGEEDVESEQAYG